MADNPKSDTGKELAAVREELREVSGVVIGMRDRERAQERMSDDDWRLGRTPPPVDGMREVYRVADEVVKRHDPSHMFDCERDGPSSKLARRLDAMDVIQKEHGRFIDQYLGEQKFKRFVMPVLIGFLGSAAGVALMALLFRGLILASAKVAP